MFPTLGLREISEFVCHPFVERSHDVRRDLDRLSGGTYEAQGRALGKIKAKIPGAACITYDKKVTETHPRNNIRIFPLIDVAERKPVFIREWSHESCYVGPTVVNPVKIQEIVRQLSRLVSFYGPARITSEKNRLSIIFKTIDKGTRDLVRP
jgi:hypothetical protein